MCLERRWPIRNFFVRVLPVVLIFIYSQVSAQEELPTYFYFEGVLTNSVDNPIVESGVVFKVGVYNPSQTCLIYEEQQTINITDTYGRFTLKIGSNTSDPKRTGSDGGYAMATVFSNSSASSFCLGGYTPASGDERVVKITVTSTAGTDVLSTFTVGAVPMALVATTLQGYQPSDFLQASGTVTPANLSTLTDGVSDASALHHHDSYYVKINDASQQSFGTGGLTSSGDLTLTGTSSLGVGTSGAPAANIHIVDATSAEIIMDDTSGTGSSSITFKDVGATAGAITMNNINRDLMIEGQNSVLLMTNGFTALTIDNAQNANFSSDLGVSGDFSINAGKFIYSPNGVSCSNFDVLEWNGTYWVCKAPSGLGVDSVTAAEIATGAVTSDEILDNTIATIDIANGAVDASKLASDSVTTPKILDGNVTGGKLASDSVDSSKIADGSVGNVDIATDAVDTTQLANAPSSHSVIVSDGSMEPVWRVIPNCHTGNYLTYNQSSGLFSCEAESSGVGVDSITATEIALDAVGSDEIASDAVGSAEIANDAVGNSEMANDAVGSSEIIDMSVSSVDLASDSVTTTKIADGNVTLSKLSGDSVNSSKIVDETITSSDIQDGSIASADIASSVIQATHMSSNAIATASIQDSAVTNSKIGDGEIQISKLAATSPSNHIMTTSATGVPSWIGLPDCTGSQKLNYDAASNTFTCNAESGGVGMSSLNGETGSAQSFGAIDTSAGPVSPYWDSNTNIHTLHIPMASDAGVSAGLVSRAQYDSFVKDTGTQSIGGTKTFTSYTRVNKATPTSNNTLVSIESGAGISGDGMATGHLLMIKAAATADLDGSVVHIEGRGTQGTLKVKNTDTSGSILELWHNGNQRMSVGHNGFLYLNGDMDIVNSLTVGTVIADEFLQPGALDAAGESAMTSGWGVSEKGRFWFNTDADTFRFWNGSTSVDLKNTDSESLRGLPIMSGLSCAANEVLKWNGSSFDCASDDTGGGADNLGDHNATANLNLNGHDIFMSNGDILLGAGNLNAGSGVIDLSGGASLQLGASGTITSPGATVNINQSGMTLTSGATLNLNSGSFMSLVSGSYINLPTGAHISITDDPTGVSDATRKGYVDSHLATKDLVLPDGSKDGQVLYYDDPGSRFDYKEVVDSANNHPSGSGVGVLHPNSNASHLEFYTIKNTDGTIGVTNDSPNGNIDLTIGSVPVDLITSSFGQYLSYRPNGASCVDGELMKWNNAFTRWECGSLSPNSFGLDWSPGSYLKVMNNSEKFSVGGVPQIGSMLSSRATGSNRTAIKGFSNYNTGVGVEGELDAADGAALKAIVNSDTIGAIGLHVKSNVPGNSVDAIRIENDTQNTFVVKGTGVTGVGTDSPSAQLHVVGSNSNPRAMIIESGYVSGSDIRTGLEFRNSNGAQINSGAAGIYARRFNSDPPEIQIVTQSLPRLVASANEIRAIEQLVADTGISVNGGGIDVQGGGIFMSGAGNDIDMNGNNQIVNLPDPIAGDQAANKQYVDEGDRAIVAKFENSGGYSYSHLEYCAFDQVSIDTDGAFDGGSYRFVAPKSGYYRVSSHIDLSVSVGGGQYIALYLVVNGAFRDYLSNYNGNAMTGDFVMNGSTIVHMISGQWLDCAFETSMGPSSISTNGGPGVSYMTIEYIGN